MWINVANTIITNAVFYLLLHTFCILLMATSVLIKDFLPHEYKYTDCHYPFDTGSNVCCCCPDFQKTEYHAGNIS